MNYSRNTIHLTRKAITKAAGIITACLLSGCLAACGGGSAGSSGTPDAAAQGAAETEHVHNWQRFGGYSATCTEDGAYAYICYDCGEEYMEHLPAPGHDWKTVSHKDPTCVEDGYDEQVCSNCGAHRFVNQDEYPATGHRHLTWKPDAEGQGESVGHIQYCKDCGADAPGTFAPHVLDDKGACSVCGYQSKKK